MKKQIILTADDFGVCDFIDEGIKQALEQGKINAVSAMVTHDDSRDRLKRLLEWRGEKNLDFQVGLHVSITSGKPLTTANGMKDGAYFKLVNTHSYKEIDPHVLFDEVETQYNYLQHTLDEYGLKTDHMTNHHGVLYFFDDLFAAYRKVAVRHGLPVRSPIPWSATDLKTYKPWWRLILPIKIEGAKTGLSVFVDNLVNNELKDKELRDMLKSQKKEIFTRKAYHLSQEQILFPYCFCDTIYGQPSAKNFDTLLEEVAAKETSSEWMFHLGDTEKNHKDFIQSAPHGINPKYFKIRSRETQELLNYPLSTAAQDRGVGIRTYRV